MPITDQLRSRIESTITSNEVVLFMKGTPQQPQCGFSATVIGILNNLGSDYETVNVLEDPEIREGIKEYSQWPTIPQLYIGDEFVGGCDVVQQMYTSGDLHQMLGREPVAVKAPEITISDDAASAIQDAMAHQPGVAVHLRIDANWDHQFSLARQKATRLRPSPTVSRSSSIWIPHSGPMGSRSIWLRTRMAQGSAFTIQMPRRRRRRCQWRNSKPS